MISIVNSKEESDEARALMSLMTRTVRLTCA